jgi:hypothetical protein
LLTFIREPPKLKGKLLLNIIQFSIQSLLSKKALLSTRLPRILMERSGLILNDSVLTKKLSNIEIRFNLREKEALNSALIHLVIYIKELLMLIPERNNSV